MITVGCFEVQCKTSSYNKIKYTMIINLNLCVHTRNVLPMA
uniref:Uncharacterized protein n=1 Tax=Arundo donax TaxID=35708 RepID=A0A0A9EC54_ARUDO